MTTSYFGSASTITPSIAMAHPRLVNVSLQILTSSAGLLAYQNTTSVRIPWQIHNINASPKAAALQDIGVIRPRRACTLQISIESPGDS
mmetsp:Transcript_44363/g.77943  ORF Transcript_44363/g.77943 Transcript_44363/m.77943 type:complete len:89 (+) Transcript_44363:1161-1427(+)